MTVLSACSYGLINDGEEFVELGVDPSLCGLSVVMCLSTTV